VWLNAFRMTPEQMRDHVATINRLRPSFVLGYVESVYDLARAAERDGLSIAAPRAVMTSAGPLEPPVREVIERAFAAPVFNRYGSREVGDVACDCPAHTGLHVIAPYHRVELLRPDGGPCGPGEVGEVVLTLLTNRTMPLIRYRIGDTAAWASGTCPCGRSWPRLATVAGRVSDMFVRPDGTRIHGEYFTHLFYFLDWVHKFQVVQMSPTHVVVRIVPREGEREPATTHVVALTDVVSKVRLVMGDACRVDVEFPDAIAPTASGKFRYTISHVLQ
jgi:phenylacetate-CoA ligase